MNLRIIETSQPQSLEQAFKILDDFYQGDFIKNTLGDLREDIFVHESDHVLSNLIKKHWLENKVGHSNLTSFFIQRNLDNRDEIAKIILRSYYRKKTGSDINLENQILTSIELIRLLKLDAKLVEQKIDDDIKNLMIENVGDTIFHKVNYISKSIGYEVSGLIQSVIIEKKGKGYILKLLEVERPLDRKEILKAAQIKRPKSYYYEPYRWIELKEKQKYVWKVPVRLEI